MKAVAAAETLLIREHLALTPPCLQFRLDSAVATLHRARRIADLATAAAGDSWRGVEVAQKCFQWQPEGGS